ncbi:MAG: hypothetical protein JNM17_10655 [Archangium sp.]|nr:hypothetical protein [Archangium sp.]
MQRLAMFAAVAVVSCLGCSKKPSVAQPEFEKFIDSVARTRPDKSFLAEGAELKPLDRGEAVGTLPVDGEVRIPMINVGKFGWTKYVPETEAKSGADLLIGVRSEICMRSDGENDNSNCTRPNVYGFKVLMRNEGGTWKVAGAAFSDTFTVR